MNTDGAYTGSIDPEVLQALRAAPAEFQGLEQNYVTRMLPNLRERETARQHAADQAIKGRYGGIGVAVVAVLLGLLTGNLVILSVIGVLAGLLIFYAMGRELSKIGREISSQMVTPIAQLFGLHYTEECGDQPLVQDMHALKLLPRWDRASFEDRLEGKRNGVDFEFFEAHLERKHRRTDSKGRTRTEWVTVFDGQCLRINFHKTFYGTTLVLRDGGIFNKLGGLSGTKRVRLEDPVFEKAFEVYSTDQVESRFLLTPDVMQKLVELETDFRGGKLRCGFSQGQLLIAVEGADLFEPVSMFTSLLSPERIRRLIDDFSAVFRLADSLATKDRASKP